MFVIIHQLLLLKYSNYYVRRFELVTRIMSYTNFLLIQTVSKLYDHPLARSSRCVEGIWKATKLIFSFFFFVNRRLRIKSLWKLFISLCFAVFVCFREWFRIGFLLPGITKKNILKLRDVQWWSVEMLPILNGKGRSPDVKNKFFLGESQIIVTETK